jgi:hypothetical protein
VILVTKKGFRLWRSGALVLATSVPFMLLVEFEGEQWSLGMLLFMILVVQPLAIGWLQRWFWDAS